MTLRTIAVGVDGSTNSRRAFEWAAELARSVGAELVLVHAVGLLEHRDDADHHHAEEWLAQIDARGVQIRRVIRDGNPVSVLEAVLDEGDIDLLVVGSRGIGRPSGLALGTTSAQLVQQAAIPVTVVPPPGTDR